MNNKDDTWGSLFAAFIIVVITLSVLHGCTGEW